MRKLVSVLLVIMLLASTVVFNVSAVQTEVSVKEALAEYETQTGEKVETNRYYFLMPNGSNGQKGDDPENIGYGEFVPSWDNEYSDDPAVFWWGAGDYDPQSFPGYTLEKGDAKSVYYADIPKAVKQLTWNNNVKTTDNNEILHDYLMQTVSVSAQYYDVGESANYPNGTTSFDNMIFVVEPDVISTGEYIDYKYAPFGGEWYYYYGDGCYGTVEDGTTDNCIRDDHFDENEQHKEPDFLYKDKFMELSGYREYDPSNNMQWETFKGYKELYYHQDEQSGETDWVLFYVRVDVFNPIEVCFTMSVGNRLIRWWAAGAAEFPYGYGVYDIENDQLYSISTAMYYGYDGLVDAFEELELGYERGDIDRDKEISILDATEIQFYLAKLKEWERDDYSYIPALGDFNEDGEMDILDATAIQRRLAGLDRDPSQYPVATPDQTFPIAPTECDHY